ncbi:MAG: heavy-metal-associated domain-containing protein [Flavobacteriales bacterium]
MKTTFFYLLFISFLFACGTSNEGGNVMANTNSEITIEGMVCETMCVKRIEDKIKRQAGVKSCDIELDSKLATVIYDDSKVKEAEIVEIIESLSDKKYKVSNVETEKISKTNSDIDRNSGDDDESVMATPSFEMPNLLDYFRNII